MVCGKRGQAALEFLTTYGWAILGLLVVIAGVSYYTDFASVRTEQCRFDGGVGCSSVDMVKVGEDKYFVDVTVVNTQRTEKDIRRALVQGPLGDEFCEVQAFAGASANTDSFQLQQGLTKTVRFVLEDTGDCDFAASGLAGLESESELKVRLFTYGQGDIVSGVVTGTLQTKILEVDASEVNACQDVGTICPQGCGYSDSGGAECYVDTDCATLCPEVGVPAITFSLSSGTNLVSLNAPPVDSDMQTILQPLLDEGSFVSIQGDDAVVYTSANIATHSGWNVQEAYYLTVDTATVLTVEVEENPIPSFTTGFESDENFMMVPTTLTPDEVYDVVAAGAMYENSLISVTDANGNMLERVDGEWVNDLGTLSVGEGLIVEVNGDVETQVSWVESYDRVDVITLERESANHVFIPYEIEMFNYFEPLIQKNWIEEIIQNEGGQRIYLDGGTWEDEIGTVDPDDFHTYEFVLSSEAPDYVDLVFTSNLPGYTDEFAPTLIPAGQAVTHIGVPFSLDEGIDPLVLFSEYLEALGTSSKITDGEENTILHDGTSWIVPEGFTIEPGYVYCIFHDPTTDDIAINNAINQDYMEQIESDCVLNSGCQSACSSSGYAMGGTCFTDDTCTTQCGGTSCVANSACATPCGGKTGYFDGESCFSESSCTNECAAQPSCNSDPTCCGGSGFRLGEGSCYEDNRCEVFKQCQPQQLITLTSQASQEIIGFTVETSDSVYDTLRPLFDAGHILFVEDRFGYRLDASGTISPPSAGRSALDRLYAYEGYLVGKATSAGSITIEGAPMQATDSVTGTNEINLEVGTNYLSVISSITPELLFRGIEGPLIEARSLDGSQRYYYSTITHAYENQGFSQLVPGEGYVVETNAAATLTIS